MSSRPSTWTPRSCRAGSDGQDRRSCIGTPRASAMAGCLARAVSATAGGAARGPGDLYGPHTAAAYRPAPPLKAPGARVPACRGSPQTGRAGAPPHRCQSRRWPVGGRGDGRGTRVAGRQACRPAAGAFGAAHMQRHLHAVAASGARQAGSGRACRQRAAAARAHLGVEDARGDEVQLVLVALAVVDGVPSVGAALRGAQGQAGQAGVPGAVTAKWRAGHWHRVAMQLFPSMG